MKFIYFKVLDDDPDMRGSGLHFCNNKTLAKLRTHPHTAIEDYSCFSDQGYVKFESLSSVFVSPKDT